MSQAKELMFDKEEFKKYVTDYLKTLSRKTLATASKEEIYQTVAFAVRDLINDKWIATHKTYDERDVKVVYYLSMEFLMGRFLGNNILNLTLSNQIKEALDEIGLDINAIEEVEPDPGLGNGGLGRLAACFLDSLSTMSYPAYGCGIRYHYGIFEQKIENGQQVEYPDHWLENGDVWGIMRKEYAVEIKFGGKVRANPLPDGKVQFVQEDYSSVMAIPYDYPVVGYNNNTVNTLRLWDAVAKNRFDLQSFNAGNYQKAVEEQNLARTLSEVLYPADEHYQGKELRLKQQYFFISATIQRVINRFKKSHQDFSLLPDKVQFQLNDTHPSVAIAELMRNLIDENQLDWEDAWEITQKVCSYTNHTIMAEALEKWPIELFSRLLPRIYQIIEEINRRFCSDLIMMYGDDHEKIRKIAVIADGQVRMAHLAIVGSHSVNGVAEIHSNILKTKELKEFNDIFPKKFNNKTNGITQRRWLAHCNPALASLVTNTIGDKWITNLSEIKKIMPYADDSAFRDEFTKIKKDNKIMLSNYIKELMDISIDPDSVYDIQIKRLHEYKRQLLNVLHILHLYNKIKTNPHAFVQPRTFIFSAKAAAGYRSAKQIIYLINSVANIINNDKTIDGKLKVLFVPNYRVSLAEKLIPAADVSEQISTAGKEASGTGNMKFMLNGALTIGTLDGANVEILEEVGEENIFIFGLKADDVMRLYDSNSYNPWYVYNMNQDVRTVVMHLINGTVSPDDPERFRDIYEALLNGYGGDRADKYFVLQDFESYKNAQSLLSSAYVDKERWTKMTIKNTACAGKFSSDRTIKQYADEIWNIKPIEVEL